MTGISPFHGDSDAETLWNVKMVRGERERESERVSQANFVMIDTEWEEFSPEASYFVTELLQLDPM